MKCRAVFLMCSALCGVIGVVLGAFGAHALKDFLVENQKLGAWETAVHYLLLHAVALLAISVQEGDNRFNVRMISVGVLWILGVLLFSGSIFILVLEGPRWLGPVTPLGGMALIGGWFALLVEGFKRLKSPGISQ